MDKEEVIKYWQDTAKDALETADSLFLIGRYHHALFFCHLALEKILKGLVLVKTGESALPIHNLVKLANQANVVLSSEQEKSLSEITTFNISARYDDIKKAFYNKAKKDYATEWFSKTKELYQWAKNQF